MADQKKARRLRKISQACKSRHVELEDVGRFGRSSVIDSENIQSRTIPRLTPSPTRHWEYRDLIVGEA